VPPLHDLMAIEQQDLLGKLFEKVLAPGTALSKTLQNCLRLALMPN